MKRESGVALKRTMRSPTGPCCPYTIDASEPSRRVVDIPFDADSQKAGNGTSTTGPTTSMNSYSGRSVG